MDKQIWKKSFRVVAGWAGPDMHERAHSFSHKSEIKDKTANITAQTTMDIYRIGKKLKNSQRFSIVGSIKSGPTSKWDGQIKAICDSGNIILNGS